jgi:hypothetical protein
MRTAAILFSVMALSTLASLASSELPSALQGSREVSDRNEDTVLKYLRRVASSSDVAIRLYYLGSCHPNSKDPIPFPFIKVQPPPKDRTGVAAVREIFKNDKNVTVTQEGGIIRIWIGKVPTAILETKLSSLTLDPIGRYNPNEAIIAINNTKEMKAAMHSLGLSPVWSAASSRALPAKGLPCLPASIKDVTVEQILDLMAKTWDGPVIYGACAFPTGASGKRRFFIDSAQDVIPKGAWKKMGIQRPD